MSVSEKLSVFKVVYTSSEMFFTATCNSDGAWTPDPKTNFQCIGEKRKNKSSQNYKISELD